MTREEILAMVPGPKFDLLVDEKVMGWAPGISPPRRFSTDIASAWLVVEKMNDYLWSVAWLPAQGKYEAAALWWPRRMRAIAPTAPGAICKAALLAVMEGEST